MSDSTTADSAFGHPSMLYAPLYNSSSNGSGDAPRYTASTIENFDQSNIQHSQAPVPTVASSSRTPYTATLPIHARQQENRSLFFEPLFNHTDFYLTTAAGTPGQSSHSGQRGDSQQDESFESEYPASTFDEPKPNEGTMRIHPNVRNHFNNLSLSSSIRVNGYPRHIQDAQIRNIFVPNWAATSLNTVPDPGGLDDAFADIYQQATGLLKNGEPLTKIFGHHPNVAALYDQQEFDRSCLLSQWAARMVHSVKRQGYDFTCFASMNVFWYVMRWMIQPSPETYAAMPEWIRPTSNQLFTPHISMADFVLWPGFRELVVQLPHLQERMAWLADMSMFINCEWPYPLEQALHRNPISGDVDLVDLAKQHVWTLQCWSVGPSFRRFVTNADSYLLIRPDEESGNA
ncbi:hc-toxin efflux carrier toxa [Fusarium flagelliforme]|uniref:Hc-toxin efflux carrier toxa n=1 Tax=Fusarium flagelliforme TaxID=2675880 RepID=A0A395N4C1_9HYPO|nr:hc-toxin efflux carrier toxa [Fusarium flagelliforme]